MAISLSFVPTGATPGKLPFDLCCSAPATVKARIWKELAEPGADVLWRLTTKPWARARTAIARLSRGRAYEVIEMAVTLAGIIGMSFAAAAIATGF